MEERALSLTRVVANADGWRKHQPLLDLAFPGHPALGRGENVCLDAQQSVGQVDGEAPLVRSHEHLGLGEAAGEGRQEGLVFVGEGGENNVLHRGPEASDHGDALLRGCQGPVDPEAPARELDDRHADGSVDPDGLQGLRLLEDPDGVAVDLANDGVALEHWAKREGKPCEERVALAGCLQTRPPQLVALWHRS